jgi:hypothetical protein
MYFSRRLQVKERLVGVVLEAQHVVTVVTA